MVSIVSFVGRSSSGKTTLLERVVVELKTRGYRVGVVKHAPHGFDIDRPGKDSWRFARAGAEIVSLASPDRISTIERLDAEPSVDEIGARFEGKVDIVLTEGYKHGDAPKILVAAALEDTVELCPGEEPLAVCLARPSPHGPPEFRDGDVGRIVNLLVARVSADASNERRLHDKCSASDLMPRHGSHRSSELEELLDESASVHGHICPGQVLGVRMALLGCQELGIERPREDAKRLIVYVEIDRCATDAIQVVTGCKLGRRTMKYVDYGKLAATFVDLRSGDAVRVVAREDARSRADLYSYPGQTKHDTEVDAYKVMPDAELFDVERVVVRIPAENMPGPPVSRVVCDQCGEEVNDRREVTVAGRLLCRACAYGAYYEPRLVCAGLQ